VRGGAAQIQERSGRVGGIMLYQVTYSLDDKRDQKTKYTELVEVASSNGDAVRKAVAERKATVVNRIILHEIKEYEA